MNADVLTYTESGVHRLMMSFMGIFRSKPKGIPEPRSYRPEPPPKNNTRIRGNTYKDKTGNHVTYYYPSPPAGRDWIKVLPESIIARIMLEVCPHAADTNFQPLEDVDLPDTCMLCDLRDLAHMTVTRRDWLHVGRATL